MVTRLQINASGRQSQTSSVVHHDRTHKAVQLFKTQVITPISRANRSIVTSPTTLRTTDRLSGVTLPNVVP